jgi:hypothetical protein
VSTGHRLAAVGHSRICSFADASADGTSARYLAARAVAWRRASSPRGARGSASVVREHRPEAALPRARRSGREAETRARDGALFRTCAIGGARASSRRSCCQRTTSLGTRETSETSEEQSTDLAIEYLFIMSS